MEHILIFPTKNVAKTERSCYYEFARVIETSKKNGGVEMVITGRIKAERIAAGLTQEDIAVKMGWSRSKYAKFENGNLKTGADDLAGFAEIVGVIDMNIFFKPNVPISEQLQPA